MSEATREAKTSTLEEKGTLMGYGSEDRGWESGLGVLDVIRPQPYLLPWSLK